MRSDQSSLAQTDISRASTLIGSHAELSGLASRRPLVSKTLDQGARIISDSNVGGYGNAGAWALIRKISVEELQEVLNTLPPSSAIWSSEELEGTPQENAAAFMLENGTVPLWHFVIEDIYKPRSVITTFFCTSHVRLIYKTLA